MTNNDIFRRVRYIFDFNEAKLVNIFASADFDIRPQQISPWLKKDDDDNYKSMPDVMLATFLNGLINSKRGKKEGEQIQAETKLNNNLIFRKLKIALALNSEQILEILQLVDFRLGKSELSAFFRNQNHKHYRECKDQILRNFLFGLQLKYRK